MLAALRFSSPQRAPLGEFTETEWNQALDFTDRTQLSFALLQTCGEILPDWVRTRIKADLADNALRWTRIKAIYQEAADAFHAAGLEFVVLKGFSHCPRFVEDPRRRFHSDLDLLFPQSQLEAARDVALELGYEPITPFDRHPMNHLPTMIRKTGYQWTGRHFDPDIPVPLELHFQLWHRETERISPEGVECFWERRQEAEVDGVRFQALHPADAIANAALHMLRHLLRGSLRPFHVYELAWMLHHSSGDTELWTAWRELHHESLRQLEAICFDIAQRWFDCQLPEQAREAIEALPLDVSRWLAMYSASPLEGWFRPNKDELWLHWTLIRSTAGRLDMLRRRLVPEQLPGPVGAIFVPKEQLTTRVRLRARSSYLALLFSRTIHHARALLPTAASAVRWFWSGTGLGSQYWQFFFAEAFFDFGMFVFFFLYNLYLLQLGFREDVIGLMSGVMTAGSVAGSLLAVVAMQRFGIRRTLLTAFALTAGLSALRAYVTFVPALLALSAAAGITSAFWPVAYSPSITQLTNEKNRPLGFSLICSAGISIGILGGLAASRMPGWLTRFHLASSSVTSYRTSLFIGCAIVLLALLPLSKVQFGALPPSERRLRRPSPMLWRFLIAMVAWNLGTGALNPFFNVFFVRRIQLPVEKLGYVFSGSQIAQVLAILATPLIFRKFGLTRSIAGMQLGTAFALLALAAAGGPWWAAGAYAGYMMSQYMSEPGMFTLLMESVRVGERNSASSLNFLVTFSGQAIAAAAAGRLLEHFGYPPVMIGAALMCVVAALLFRALLSDPKPAATSDP
ncbi:MAG TPA: MFS transporter [Bryobacteraceae bacterium]|nr:MFS transporter [Bryobacteraceae bacterium]